MSGDDHEYFMARAIRLAHNGLNTTHPNPRVGCVIVKDGAILGEGWHVRCGAAHAEINALKGVDRNAAGATVYVTLEPCCHEGRTGPCTKALIDAKIGEVVAATLDPNPEVSGKGMKTLQAAGIRTTSGVMETQAKALNPGFFKRMRTGQPFVRCKLAMSLDGRTAMASGESRWITSAQARADVQRLRARSSAILTGIGTALADDPSLNVRNEQLATVSTLPPPLSPPVRVIIDSRLRLSPQAKLLQIEGTTWVVHCEGSSAHEAALRQAGAQVFQVKSRDHRVDLSDALALLARHEMNEVLLECGRTLAGAMMGAGLVDELIIYVAPVLLGDQARGLLRLDGLEKLCQGVRLSIEDVRTIGADLRIMAKPTRSP